MHICYVLRFPVPHNEIIDKYKIFSVENKRIKSRNEVKLLGITIDICKT